MKYVNLNCRYVFVRLNVKLHVINEIHIINELVFILLHINKGTQMYNT